MASKEVRWRHAGQNTLFLTTLGNQEDASAFARRLVESKLAACVSTLPKAISVYRWQGKVEEEQEVMLLIKSAKPLREAICKAFEDHHPYDCPELLELDPIGGSAAYLGWLGEQVKAPSDPEHLVPGSRGGTPREGQPGRGDLALQVVGAVLFQELVIGAVKQIRALFR